MKKNVAVPHATESHVASRVRHHLAHTVKPSFRTLLFFLAAGIFLFSCEKEEEEDKIKPSSEATMTSLTLTVESTDYAITFKDRQGEIKLPYATTLPVTAKVAAVALSAKATGVKVGGDVTIPASKSFTLTITAEDKTTTQEYTVTVQKGDAPGSEAAITDLTLTVEDTDYEIMFEGTQGTMKLPYSTEIPAEVEVKEIALSDGATSVDQGTQLTVTNNTITITVTAEDGTTTQEYTVRLTVSVGITSFTFEVIDNESMALATADRKRIVGMINQEAKTITFDEQSAYVYRDKLKATFEVSEAGAAVQVGGAPQTSGTTEQDFTSAVSYVVRAQDGTETTYTVTLLKSVMATIEDDQFRKKLKEFFPDAFTEDKLDITHDDVVNKDGELDVRDQTPKLTSVKGIEFFTALTKLSFQRNALDSLDLSKNTALKDLDCGSNSSLTSLDVSKNTALTSLNCFSNRLTSLDVTEHTALKTLYCSDNKLASLDVSANTALTRLNCGNNLLTALDVRKNTALTYLECGSNVGLTSLDVQENTALTTLNCERNSLTSLDVSKNTALTTLRCHNSINNSLTSLDMTGMRSVTDDGLNIGTGTGTNNPLLATLRVNTALQDRKELVTMKTNRAAGLTIITVNNDGAVVCNDYTPVSTGGNCNDTP